MNWESINASAPAWTIPTAVIAAVLIATAGFAYARTDGNRWLRLSCMTLKLIAVALLALCLIEPVQRKEYPRPQANLVPVLIDTSQSMQVVNPGNSISRGAVVSAKLDHDQAWKRRLLTDFDVRHYTFGSRLDHVSDPLDLKFTDSHSGLSSGLETIAQRFRGRPVAGVLLFTDGNLTDDTDFDWSQLGVPVFPVVAKESGTLHDLRFTNVAVSQSDFEAAPISVAAHLAGDLERKGKALVQVLDAGNQVIAEQSIDAPTKTQDRDIHFQFRPEKSGVQFYRLRVAHEDDRVDWLSKTSSLEATLANNEYAFAVHRRHGPYRVLYLSGRPNWEFKFLRRALQEDAEIELVGLMRIAKKQPKFNFQDRSVSDTNPLFAGLGKAEEEAAAAHDEPVLVRMGVKEGAELKEGFPSAEAELFSYHAILLDDIESSFFSEDQQLLIRRFVSSRGGALMFLGGQESLDGVSDSNTPLAELAPVYLKRETLAGAAPPAAFELTREGWLQPWLRMRTTEVAEKERIRLMPLFQTINPVGTTKPGASVLIRGQSEGGDTVPLLISQRFGSGRTMALTVGDLWRWGMHRREDQPYDLPQAWRQMIRYLVSDVPQRVEMQALDIQRPNQPVRIEVTVKDENYQPTEQVELRLKITPPTGKAVDITLQPQAEKNGVFTAEYWSRDTGGYLAELVASNPDGTEMGRAEAGWTAEPAAAEFQNLETNIALLQTLAEQTGGKVINLDELDAFVSNWPADKVPIKDVAEKPVWHTPWILLCVMTCLCCEWGLRRWRGFA